MLQKSMRTTASAAALFATLTLILAHAAAQSPPTAPAPNAPGAAGAAAPAAAQPAAQPGATQPAASQPGTSQPATGPAQTQATKPADIYDPAADAPAQIAAALAQAARENQRVLIMFGGNWCGWCHRLHTLFKQNKDVARALLYEYQLVLVDVGRFNKNMELATGYGIELKKTGVPFLTVLGPDGKVLINQATGILEQGPGHDPQKVLEFLNRWKAEPRDAETVLKDGLARAAAEHKAVLLHLGAPWCIWCRRLEAFLARPEIEPLIGRDYIDLKIDVDRMANGKAVAERLRKTDKGGIPWLAILDPQAQVLATSDAPDTGNIGYPGQPEEIAHFMTMLHKGAQKLSADDFRRIEDALKEAAAKLQPSP